MNVSLIMFKENGERKLFPISPGKTVIGRKEDCGLRIPLGEISRKHALLMVDEKTAILRDLGSANGTYVNNKRITEQELEPGDHIVIGPVVFTVQIDGQPEDLKPVQTRLEARKPAQAVTNQRSASTNKDEDDDLFSDESDPISDLEALTSSDDDDTLDLSDSFMIDSPDDSKG
ncbi:MAG TPA: FHA domain-containing protein [Phycisphaerae bacterium]|jgi:pSer/pThr/pTyr-binding forkhead associated (FHA) protein|nr:FHA domain-containing protein [Phycisphaerae bacterium]HOB74062.1 FHA domain-containing protein [Phycisphaerae bacterium]HOJ53807.1 FHA domain-containing protein [Phycisphaerae bacterium]HOL26138.1 FHA domain-containing protein [Phycisphaerae bacterium]HPP20125.1 FHA domain-containing protein [Phycisphaerae bacterium]